MTMELLFPLLILLLFIPIFLSGRRQRRQMQEMQKMQAALEVGDVVTTTSGVRGTIVDASYEDTIDIDIASDPSQTLVTTWVRGAVREKVQTEAADSDSASDTSADDASDDAPSITASDDTAAGAAPSLEKSTLEKSTVEKDESSNGTARS
jgi:preprotein translocase subunit YajC